MTPINRLFNMQPAGQLAQQLDAADGKKDGKISASVWNGFVRGKGGKTIKNYIEVGNATSSISSYLMKNSKTSGKNIQNLMQDWLSGLNQSASRGGGF